MSKILIVDDVKALREMLGAAVRSMQHEPTLCSSAAEATIALASSTSFDLVLLDIELEDGDGISLMKQIKGAKEARKINTKVCFISGSREKDTILKAINSGGDDYILKPIDPKTFKEKIESLLNQSSISANPNFVLEVNLKANLFESLVPSKMTVQKVSTKELHFVSDDLFDKGKVLDIAIPTLGNHLGYKGTFRGTVIKSDKNKNGKFEVIVALQPLSALGIEGKLKALCAKGELISDFEVPKPVEKKPATAATKAKPHAPPSSLSMAALSAFAKK
jgi:DNA-binding response OmpR family regulator